MQYGREYIMHSLVDVRYDIARDSVIVYAHAISIKVKYTSGVN